MLNQASFDANDEGNRECDVCLVKSFLVWLENAIALAGRVVCGITSWTWTTPFPLFPRRINDEEFRNAEAQPFPLHLQLSQYWRWSWLRAKWWCMCGSSRLPLKNFGNALTSTSGCIYVAISHSGRKKLLSSDYIQLISTAIKETHRYLRQKEPIPNNLNSKSSVHPSPYYLLWLPNIKL